MSLSIYNNDSKQLMFTMVLLIIIPTITRKKARSQSLLSISSYLLTPLYTEVRWRPSEWSAALDPIVLADSNGVIAASNERFLLLRDEGLSPWPFFSFAVEVIAEAPIWEGKLVVLLAFIALAAGTDSTLAVVVVTAAVVIGNEFAVLSVIWIFSESAGRLFGMDGGTYILFADFWGN